jgi:predicted metal-dependent hydrolase
MIIEGIEFELTRKNIKYLRLTIREGKVRVSAPLLASDKEIFAFIHKKMHLIKKHINSCSGMARFEKRYVEGERFQLWGKDYTLRLKLGHAANACLLSGNEIILCLKSDNIEIKKKLVKQMYLEQLREKAQEYLRRWQSVTGLESDSLRIRDMKSRWGSCNIPKKDICLNLKLACFEELCLSYVTLHELLHLKERGHNKRFYALLWRYMPEWQKARQTLNGRA